MFSHFCLTTSVYCSNTLTTVSKLLQLLGTIVRRSSHLEFLFR